MKNRLKQIIHLLVEKITDILLPKEEKVKILENLSVDKLFEKIPLAENFDIKTRAGFQSDKVKAIFSYQNTLCRQAIWEIKYRANRKLIENFSLLLYEYILEELSDLETFNNFKNIILIPIPSTKARLKEKGFNQCELICEELLNIDKSRNNNNFTLLKNFLIKARETPHQARVKNRKERLENLKNTFTVNQKMDQGLTLVKNSYIIIDDVITTGATMREAFRAFSEAGIPPRKIRGFALAH